MSDRARRTIPYVGALDGARGVAVAGVLLFHGGHLLGGYLGVDFFFVLSGFLITSLLLAESSDTGTVGLGAFWARRARRLLPALTVLMVGVALYCVTLASPVQLSQIRGDALATLGYVANWHEIYSHQNYFALFTSPSPLNHTWSLAIEEQFYLIWPLVFVALLARFQRATPRAVLVSSLGLAGISSALMFASYDVSNVSPAYFGTETRAAAILFGAALAAWLAIHGPARTRNARIVLEVIGLGGAAVLAIAWARLDGQSSTLYRGGFLVCGLSATAVIAAAAHPQSGPLSWLLSLRPLRGLGLISYGVYLYHWPIDVALDQRRAGFGGWPLFAVQTVVTVAVAVASYRFVEQPVRRGALSRVQWRRLTPAIAIALVVAILVSTNGARSPGISQAEFPLFAAAKAFQTAKPGARRVMIAGDSVAHFLADEAKHINTQPPIAVYNAGLAGCTFPPGITSARYTKTIATRTFFCDPDWEPKAIAIFRPNVVFWITNGPAHEVLYRGRWLQTCSAEYAALYEESLRRELTILGAGGAKVVITTEPYPRYITAALDGPTDCENRLRRSVAAATGVQIIDLQGYICPGGKCRLEQNGVVLRKDGVHFEGAGARLVVKWLLDQVKTTASSN